MIKNNEDVIIYARDARQCFGNYCSQWKNFCENNEIPWKDAILNGVSAKKLLETNNAMAIKLVRWKYEQQK